jgi:endonuclease/exonuclease/phosphatase (EEP) superfamily protein YafD
MIRGTGLLLFLMWSIGQIARDRTWLTGMCFYVPSPVLAGLCLCSSAVDAWRRRWRACIVACLLAIPPALAVGLAENHWRRPAPAPSDAAKPLRAIHWNVFNGRLGWENVVDRLAEHAADLYVVSEPPEYRRVENLQARLGPEYRMLKDWPFGVVARGEIHEPTWLVKEGRLRVLAFEWRVAATSLRVFAADHTAKLTVARDPGLRSLLGLMVERKPDLVVGDFNAPRLSLALSSLPQGYTHAYDAAGSGWSYTWPVPLPVYAIDQCIFGPRLRPLRYELETWWCSDHRMQVLDFVVVP